MGRHSARPGDHRDDETVQLPPVGSAPVGPIGPTGPLGPARPAGHIGRGGPPSLSPQARVLVLSGVIAGAVVTSFLLAAAFVSLGTPPPVSEDTTRAAASSASPSRTPRPTPASPSPTPTASVTPMVTPLTETPEGPDQDGPIVQFFASSQWDDGFVGIITITNTTDEPLQWELSFELRDVEIDGVWQAQIDSDGDDMTARGVDHNAVIEPGGQTEFGFRAIGDDPDLRDCTLNGEPCQLQSD